MFGVRLIFKPNFLLRITSNNNFYETSTDFRSKFSKVCSIIMSCSTTLLARIVNTSKWFQSHHIYQSPPCVPSRLLLATKNPFYPTFLNTPLAIESPASLSFQNRCISQLLLSVWLYNWAQDVFLKPKKSAKFILPHVLRI